TSGTITSWKWDLPGSSATNSTSSGQFPSVSYTNPGTYTVSLTITGPSGSVTETKPNLITVTDSGTDSGTPPPPSAGSSNVGLVAAYGFDEDNGTTVIDTSGEGNHGIIEGAARITSGRYGKALKFDGLNDLVTVNHSNSLNLTDGMTLEAWVYPTELSGWCTVIMKETSDGLAYSLYAHDKSPRPAGYINLKGKDINVRGNQGALPLNTWTHLVLTYDATFMRLYENGIEVGVKEVSGDIVTSSQLLMIGGNLVWGEYFTGLIDEVRIYNRALTATEVNNNLAAAVSVLGSVE
ncbi:MAG: PKD domain-containing protein, partial [Methyloprofundus sp.]|nr:PKD domain-containing protein [Methyloprofundus sp.]